MKKPSIGTISPQMLLSTLRKNQMILFFVISSILVAIGILLILKIFSGQTSQTTEKAITELLSKENQATVEKLRKLNPSDNLEDLPAPSGRFSPFDESTWNSDIMKR